MEAKKYRFTFVTAHAQHLRPTKMAMRSNFHVNIHDIEVIQHKFIPTVILHTSLHITAIYRPTVQHDSPSRSIINDNATLLWRGLHHILDYSQGRIQDMLKETKFLYFLFLTWLSIIRNQEFRLYIYSNW